MSRKSRRKASKKSTTPDLSNGSVQDNSVNRNLRSHEDVAHSHSNLPSAATQPSTQVSVYGSQVSHNTSDNTTVGFNCSSCSQCGLNESVKISQVRGK